jgi:hypothetical protein
VVSPRFLVDANVLSGPLKPFPNTAVLQQIEKHRAEVVTAALVWHELQKILPGQVHRDQQRAIDSAKSLRSQCTPALSQAGLCNSSNLLTERDGIDFQAAIRSAK